MISIRKGTVSKNSYKVRFLFFNKLTYSSYFHSIFFTELCVAGLNVNCLIQRTYCNYKNKSNIQIAVIFVYSNKLVSLESLPTNY